MPPCNKGIGVGKSLMLIIILAVLLFTTAVMGDVFTEMLGMGIGDQFHLTMGEISASYTTSSSFREKTEITEGLPMACEKVVFRNRTMRGDLGPEESYFVSYTPQYGFPELEVNCGVVSYVKFEDGKIVP